MGSMPWKYALWYQLSPDWEGVELRAETGHVPPQVTVGRYTGLSSQGRRQWLDFTTAPEGMLPGDEGYWDYEVRVPLERGLKIYHGDELIAEAPELTKRMKGGS